MLPSIIASLIDSVARYLMASGGKVCEWYPPLTDSPAMQAALTEALAEAKLAA